MHQRRSRVSNDDAHRRLHHIARCTTSHVSLGERAAGNRRGKSEASGQIGERWERKTPLVDLDRFRRGKRASGEKEERSNELSFSLSPLLSHCLLMVIAKSTLVHFRPFVPRKRPPRFRDRSNLLGFFSRFAHEENVFYSTLYMKNTLLFATFIAKLKYNDVGIFLLL